MIESDYQQFLQTVNNLSNKVGEFGYARYGPDEIEISNSINKNPIHKLKQHLDVELSYISKIFSVDQDSSLVIASLILNYHLCREVDHYFITIDSLASAISLNTLEFLRFNKAILNLKNKNIVEVRDLDFSLIKAIEQLDQHIDYSELIEISKITYQDKTYNFTNTALKKITNL